MKRIEKLQKRLSDWPIDALLIENPIDLLYLTGMKMSRGRLWVWPHKAELHVDGRYYDEAKIQTKCPVFLWKNNDEPKFSGRIGFDSHSTSVANLEKLKRESSDAQWVSIVQPLIAQRMIKDVEEIKIMKEAARITWNGIQHIQSHWKEGISEQDLALAFEFFVRKIGASSLAFEPIVAFGENTAYPHHRSTTTRLKKNQIILIDVGVIYERYCSDVTRTFFFGQPDFELERMLKIVREADQAAQGQVKIGSPISLLDRAARDVLKNAGMEPFFTHSLGHGIGLEPHETPLIRVDGADQAMPISEKMVIAIEPGLYRPGLGGVRYENSGVVTKNGFESFYPD